jgi:hypothetical protein
MSSQETERLCICVLGIDFASLYDFPGILKCCDSVLLFYFSFSKRISRETTVH